MTDILQNLSHKPIKVKLPKIGLLALTSKHSIDFKMNYQKDSFAKLIWIIKGKSKLVYAKKSIILPQYSWIYIPAFQKHFFDDYSPTTLAIFCFDKKQLNMRYTNICKWLNDLDQQPQYLKEPWINKEISQTLKFILLEQQNNNALKDEVCWMHFANICIHICRYANKLENKTNLNNYKLLIYNLKRYIEEHCCEILIYEEFAEQLGISSRTLRTYFKKYIGMNMSLFQQKCRINYACKRLLENHDIIFTAFDSGFNDLAYFYRIFKKLKGCTPNAFLKSHKA